MLLLFLDPYEEVRRTLPFVIFRILAQSIYLCVEIEKLPKMSVCLSVDTIGRVNLKRF